MPDPGERWCILYGFHQTDVVGPVQRFKCLFCGKSFCERSFHIDFYTKKLADYHEILTRNASGESVSAIARNLGLRPNCVTNRINRLARNCLAFHSSMLRSHPLADDLVADGFESFDRSQYFPNNINILVGARSQFLYAFTHTTLRRKGRMTRTQKRRRAELERVYRAPRRGVEDSFARLCRVIPSLWSRSSRPTLHFITDLHPAYPRALARVPSLAVAMERREFSHHAFSSTIPRTVVNPLFAVNYMDREIRKDQAAHRRESTCFCRNTANGLSRMAVYLVWHNYMKPHRINGAAQPDPSHAEVAEYRAGGAEELARRLFPGRAFLSFARLEEWADRIWQRLEATPLKRRPEYLPKFALA